MKKAISLLIIIVLCILAFATTMVGCKGKNEESLPVFTVNFDLSKIFLDELSETDIIVPAIQVTQGEKVIFPELSTYIPQGYSAIWYMDNSPNPYDENQGVKGDMTLTFDYEPSKYNITYEYPEWARFSGIASMSPYYIAFQTTILPSASNADKAENAAMLCILDNGWKDENGTYYGWTLTGGEVFGDLHLIWTYTYREYPITYLNLQGATNPNPDYFQVEHQPLTLLPPTSTSGKVFSHWELSSTSTGLTNGRVIDTITYEYPFYGLYLYAIWED